MRNASTESGTGVRRARGRRPVTLFTATASAAIVAGVLAAPYSGTGAAPATRPVADHPTVISVRPAVAPAPASSSQALYRRCIALVREEAGTRGETVPGDLTGRATAISDSARTVVVANRASTWACNLAPDQAVSGAGRVVIHHATASDLAVAENVRGTDGAADERDLVWGGGALPRGVTSLTYAFPDGHHETASTAGGFWVMQYLAPAWFTGLGESAQGLAPITVTLDGPGGHHVITLEWGTDTCNQISHGC